MVERRSSYCARVSGKIMTSQEILTQAKEVLEAAPGVVEFVRAQLLLLVEQIRAHFGDTGVVAFAIVALSVSALFLVRIVSFAVAAVKYLILPATILAVLVVLISPYTFAQALPVTSVACCLFLVFKS